MAIHQTMPCVECSCVFITAEDQQHLALYAFTTVINNGIIGASSTDTVDGVQFEIALPLPRQNITATIRLEINTVIEY
jgi:hypothetical protein